LFVACSTISRQRWKPYFIVYQPPIKTTDWQYSTTLITSGSRQRPSVNENPQQLPNDRKHSRWTPTSNTPHARKKRLAATFGTGTVRASCNMFRKSGNPPAGFRPNIDITPGMSSADVEARESSILKILSVMAEQLFSSLQASISGRSS